MFSISKRCKGIYFTTFVYMRNKVIHEVKDITKLAIGALMVGGVFK